MYRVLAVIVLGAAISAGRPVAAQPPPKKDEVRKLEAEIEKVRSQIRDVEARLKKAEADMKGKPSESKRGGEGWRRIDPEMILKLIEQFGGKDGKDWGKMDVERILKIAETIRKMSQDGDNKFGRSWGWSGGSRRPAEESKSSDLEKRLDQILREVEELRRDLRRN